MKIQVADTCCARCKATELLVRDVCDELKIDAPIEYVYDAEEYVKLGIRLTPAVPVDGKITLQGRVPTGDEFKTTLPKRNSVGE